MQPHQCSNECHQQLIGKSYSKYAILIILRCWAPCTSSSGPSHVCLLDAMQSNIVQPQQCSNECHQQLVGRSCLDEYAMLIILRCWAPCTSSSGPSHVCLLDAMQSNIVQPHQCSNECHQQLVGRSCLDEYAMMITVRCWAPCTSSSGPSHVCLLDAMQSNIVQPHQQ